MSDARLSPGLDLPDMPGARRAALALHALASADRRWLLDRLGDVQRARMTSLLAELDAMGVHFDPADIAALGQSATASAPVAPIDSAPDWRAALADEPEWVIAALAQDHGLLAPAARQALQAAAHRRSDQPIAPRPAAARVVPQAPGARWLAGVRKWRL